MTSEELEAMMRLEYFGGHEQGIHWHPNTGHVWLGRWAVSHLGRFYVRTCVCNAYERWSEK